MFIEYILNQKEEKQIAVGNLSTGVFERRAAGWSEAFSLLTCLKVTTFVLRISLYDLRENLCKQLPMNSKRSPSRLPSVAQKRLGLSSLVAFPIFILVHREKQTKRKQNKNCKN